MVLPKEYVQACHMTEADDTPPCRLLNSMLLGLSVETSSFLLGSGLFVILLSLLAVIEFTLHRLLP